MGKLGQEIETFFSSMKGDSDQARIRYRANQVRDRYKHALEVVYRDSADIFLAHTNNVYIMKKEGIPTLIVYVDESIFAAELNAQRELIKLKLLELFGEEVEEFEIHVSRGKYKAHHPYLDEHRDSSSEERVRPQALDEHELDEVRKTVAIVEGEEVRKALQKAMTADMEWKKGENRKKS